MCPRNQLEAVCPAAAGKGRERPRVTATMTDITPLTRARSGCRHPPPTERSLSASQNCTSVSCFYHLPCGLKAKAKPPRAPCAACRASPSLGAGAGLPSRRLVTSPSLRWLFVVTTRREMAAETSRAGYFCAPTMKPNTSGDTRAGRSPRSVRIRFGFPPCKDSC